MPSGIPVLSLLIFLPALGAVGLLFLRRESLLLIKNLAFAVSVADFLLALSLALSFNPGSSALQFVERASWVPRFGISYLVGVDGISLPLILLTTFLVPLSLLASYAGITERVKEFMVLMLLLETGMLGVFLALDLILFYVFWEGMLIPMYLLIGIWGGERRIYATVKFILYTMAGSVFLLVAILALGVLHRGSLGQMTFDLTRLVALSLPPGSQMLLFIAFALAFAVKVPMVPFHTWLPDAHTEAPTAGSVILAGVLLKMGVYGFLRFALPLFPEAARSAAPVIATLALTGIIYGAAVSLVQPDLKKLVAYSSVSHLGFVMLGLFTFTVQGIEGSLLQMVNHGLSTGALFLLVGMLYERRHTRLIAEFGGLYRSVPLFGAVFLIITFSSIGLPGLNGFVGEFLILLGAFRHRVVWAVVGVMGVVLGAVYMLGMVQRVMFGEITRAENRTLPDLSLREKAILLPILILVVWIGLYPRPFLTPTEASVKALLSQMEKKMAPPRAAEVPR